MTHFIPVGTTEPQDFQLWNGTSTLVGTGFTPTIEVTNAATGAAVTGLTVAWLTQATGTVRVSGAGALPIGNYLVRYRLTDSGAVIGFAPNGAQADHWRVVKIPAL